MGLGLDLTQATEQGTPLPDGSYPVICNKAEVSATRSGGEMIKIQLKVTDGPSAGRVIFEQFNIKNANPQAVQIGLGQLKGFLKASGHTNPNRLESVTDLQGLKTVVRVKTVDNNDGYGPQVRVKGYGVSGTSPSAQAPQPAVDGAPVTQAAPAQVQAGQGSNPF